MKDRLWWKDRDKKIKIEDESFVSISEKIKKLYQDMEQVVNVQFGVKGKRGSTIVNAKGARAGVVLHELFEKFSFYCCDVMQKFPEVKL